MNPILEINLSKLTDNARAIRLACERRGVDVLAATKVVASDIRIVDALARGGIRSFADSRLDNLIRLKEQGCTWPLTLLRLPAASDADAVVRSCEFSLNSEPATIRALSEAAVRAGVVHHIILMVDVGDRREGILPEDAVDVASEVKDLPGIHLAGIGTNLGCYGGILPSTDNMNLLLKIRREIELVCGIHLDIVSGGASTSLKQIYDGSMPRGVNQLRVGEGILFGYDGTRSWTFPGMHEDAFILSAEIIELKEKSSLPVGEPYLDAFFQEPQIEDRGIRKRAIVALGKLDVNLEGVFPLDDRIEILGASSDHMILDVTDAGCVSDNGQGLGDNDPEARAGGNMQDDGNNVQNIDLKTRAGGRELRVGDNNVQNTVLESRATGRELRVGDMIRFKAAYLALLHMADSRHVTIKYID